MSINEKILESRRIAEQFADQLNADPKEAQNWHALGSHDDLPSGDYAMLLQQFGEVTTEMVDAYKKAFNRIFVR